MPENNIAAPEWEKLSPLARHFVRVLATHGGTMAHFDVLKELPEHSETELKAAVAEARASKLVYDTWPTAFRPQHTWTVAPNFLEPLRSISK